MRHEFVPCAGETGFFKAKDSSWHTTYLGNDQSPWREKPDIVKIAFNADSKIKVASKQPDFILTSMPASPDNGSKTHYR